MELIKQELKEIIDAEYGSKIVKFTRVRGGCISRAFKLDLSDNSSLFIKISETENSSMFTAERAGLDAIRSSGTIRAPEPLQVGEFSRGGSYLLLEYIEFARQYSRRDCLAALGERLALLHLSSPPPSNEGFGFSTDNTIGTTPQPNKWNRDWIAFFLEQRLQHQINLARDAEIQSLSQKLYKNLPILIGLAPTKCSLIHGDLWTGNFSFAADTLEPVVFDPASYWADSEAEFGISYMQGGLGDDFFQAYNRLNPPRVGWEIRREIYMLYHSLNHLNLWGAHWRDLCVSTMRNILENLLPRLD